MATGHIPRIIHQTWKSEAVPDRWRAWADSWKRLHPRWEYRLWTDAMNRGFVASEFPELLPVYDAFSYNIQRADAARYLILHRYGGMYVDLDIECLRPVDPVLADHTLVLGAEPRRHAHWLQRDRLLCNAFMAAVAGHAFLSAVIDRLRRTDPKILLHKEVLSSTGPVMLDEIYRLRGDNPDVFVLEPEVIYPLTSDSEQIHALRAGRSDAEEIKRACIERGAYAIHYWANSWVRDLSGPLRNPHPLDVPGFVFFPGVDSLGYDLGNAGRDITMTARRCQDDGRAVGFNTDGFLKHYVRPRSQWTPIGNAQPNEGLYIKSALVRKPGASVCRPEPNAVANGGPASNGAEPKKRT